MADLYRYEIDQITFFVDIYKEGNEYPSIHQPFYVGDGHETDAEGNIVQIPHREWASYAEAENWAKLTTDDLNNPGTPVEVTPESVFAETPTTPSN